MSIIVTGPKIAKISIKVDGKKGKRPYIPANLMHKYKSLEEEASHSGYAGMPLLNSQLQMNLGVQSEANKHQGWKKNNHGKIVEMASHGTQSKMASPLRCVAFLAIGQMYILKEFAKIRDLILRFLPKSVELLKQETKFAQDFPRKLHQIVLLKKHDVHLAMFSFLQSQRDKIFNSWTMDVRVHHTNWASFAGIDGVKIYDFCFQSETMIEFGAANGKKYVIFYFLHYNLYFC